MNRIAVAIVGDRFMRPDFFVEALERLDGARFSIRTLELPWPDEPMVHGYRDGGLAGLKEYLVVYGRARVTEGGAPELLQRLAHVYLGSDVVFPPMPDPPPGYVTRIAVERIGGVGPWA